MVSITFDGHKNEVLVEQKYFTGSMPLLTPNHSPKTRGGTTIIMKCGVRTSTGGRSATSRIPITLSSPTMNNIINKGVDILVK